MGRVDRKLLHLLTILTLLCHLSKFLLASVGHIVGTVLFRKTGCVLFNYTSVQSSGLDDNTVFIFPPTIAKHRFWTPRAEKSERALGTIHIFNTHHCSSRYYLYYDNLIPHTIWSWSKASPWNLLTSLLQQNIVPALLQGIKLATGTHSLFIPALTNLQQLSPLSFWFFWNSPTTAH